MPRARDSMQAAEWWGTAKTSFLFHARGIEHHSNGVQNCARHDQPRAGVRPDRQAEERLRHHRRPGQRPGRPRARTEVRSAPRLARHQQPRAPRATSPACGASTRQELPGPGRRRLRAVPQDRPRRDQGPAVDLLQPEGVAARQRLRHALPREAGVLRRHRLLPERHRAARRRRAARQPARGRRRARSRRSRAASSRSTRPSTVRARRAQDWRIIQDIAQALGRPHGFTFASPREIFEELRVASKGGVADYSGMTYEKIDAADGRLLALLQRGSAHRRADRRPSRHAAAVRAGQLQPGRQGQRPVLLPRRPARFNVADYRAAGRRRERRVSDLS